MEICKSFLKKLGRQILNLLCPPRCPICRETVDEAHCLCPNCYGKLNFITHPCCEICGRPFEYAAFNSVVCGSCLKNKPKFSMARSILEYDDFSKQLILSFKHGDRTDLTPILVKFLLLADPKIFENVDMIVPVPQHWARRFKRQYNQASLLGKVLGKQKGISFNPSILRRIKNTESQGHKLRKQREQNVKGVFHVMTPDKIRGKTILVIDDVMTTGATLNECAKVLRRAGAKEVKAITVYRVINL